MMRRHMIRAVEFRMDGSAVLEYITPESDLKANGVALNKALYVPDDADYADLVDAIKVKAEELIDDVLTDMEQMGPPEPRSLPDDDENLEPDWYGPEVGEQPASN